MALNVAFMLTILGVCHFYCSCLAWEQTFNEKKWCLIQEKRYVNNYGCLKDPDSFLCWVLKGFLERWNCRQPCYKDKDQQCVEDGQSCTLVSALCLKGQVCCRLPSRTTTTVSVQQPSPLTVHVNLYYLGCGDC